MNHIAFLSMLAWLNATIAWMTGRVGYPHVSWGVRHEQLQRSSFKSVEALPLRQYYLLRLLRL